jgi:hypothetical protein
MEGSSPSGRHQVTRETSAVPFDTIGGNGARSHKCYRSVALVGPEPICCDSHARKGASQPFCWYFFPDVSFSGLDSEYFGGPVMPF